MPATVTWRTYERKNALASSEARSLRKAVAGVELAPVDSLEHEHPLRDVRPDHAWDDESLRVLDEASDHLRVVGLLGVVELGAEV